MLSHLHDPQDVQSGHLDIRHGVPNLKELLADAVIWEEARQRRRDEGDQPSSSPASSQAMAALVKKTVGVVVRARSQPVVSRQEASSSSRGQPVVSHPEAKAAIGALPPGMKKKI